MKKISLITIILLLATPSLFALPEPKNFQVPDVHVDSLVSRFNGVNYHLYIQLPKSYAGAAKHYSVIYLLDADYSFLFAKQIIEHLSDRHRIEEYIVVGVAYSDREYKKNRTRDYTPSYVRQGGYGLAYQQYSGGAAKFYRFLHKELMPYLAVHYRINKNATFVGHSFGGLFGVYLLLHHPETFDNYIIVSPSLWYDNHLLLKAAKNTQTFSVRKRLQLALFIGEKENNGDYKMVDDVKALNDIIDKKNHQNVINTMSVIPEMDHDTVFPSALTLGLMKNSLIH